MKKILLIALCLGFAMTQSIQTKQVEVTITDWSDINLYELIENPVLDSNYSFELVKTAIDIGQLTDDATVRLEHPNISPSVNMDYETGWVGRIIFFLEHNNTYSTTFHQIIINETYRMLDLQPENSNIFEDDNFTLTLTFWVTGLFQGELLPDTGDLNFDGNIDVVDVVILVNSILG